MTESTTTGKGQTTAPADIRALVHAKPGTRWVGSVMPGGTIIVQANSKFAACLPTLIWRRTQGRSR
ncbi:MAG: hypothetical protein HY855_05580 [Burkholderiales bacterium]|nr:hypothetical protein [Burkholderiales bacterium]